MKKIIAKQSKRQPLDEMSQKERGDYTLAIVEEMRDGFKAMGEGFAGMQNELIKVRECYEATLNVLRERGVLYEKFAREAAGYLSFNKTTV